MTAISQMTFSNEFSNLQAKVSATVRLFGGYSSHAPFFFADKVKKQNKKTPLDIS